MATIDVHNLAAKKVGTVELSDIVFAGDVHEGVLYDVVRAQRASARAGTHKAKGRAAVSATSKKLYRQKGTGRGRHGNRAAPSFVGGGVAHGPIPRDYSYRPPRSVRIAALRAALAYHFHGGTLHIVDNFDLETVKTKTVFTAMDALGAIRGAVIVDAKANDNLRLAAGNLPKHTFLPPEGVNTYDVLRHRHLVITQDAVKALESRLLRERGAADVQAA